MSVLAYTISHQINSQVIWTKKLTQIENILEIKKIVLYLFRYIITILTMVGLIFLKRSITKFSVLIGKALPANVELSTAPSTARCVHNNNAPCWIKITLITILTNTITIMPAWPLHKHDIISVDFNHFPWIRICDILGRHLSMLTYIHYHCGWVHRHILINTHPQWQVWSSKCFLNMLTLNKMCFLEVLIIIIDFIYIG